MGETKGTHLQKHVYQMNNSYVENVCYNFFICLDKPTMLWYVSLLHAI